jgi:hypothetical protein
VPQNTTRNGPVAAFPSNFTCTHVYLNQLRTPRHDQSLNKRTTQSPTRQLVQAAGATRHPPAKTPVLTRHAEMVMWAVKIAQARR